MLKKLLILFVAVIVGIGSFATGFYFLRQLISVPDWYYGRDRSIQQTSTTTTTEDINRLIIREISEKSESSHILRAAKSIKANITTNQLEIGGVFNPSEIPAGSLDETQQTIVDKAIGTFPQLKNIDIYVGIVGTPKIENDRLGFGENSSLKVGKLTFPVSEFAQRFGLSPEQFQQYLDLEIAKLDIQGININQDTTTVR
jgi:hypothetical protein